MKLRGCIVCPKIYLLIYFTWGDDVKSRDNYIMMSKQPPSWISKFFQNVRKPPKTTEKEFKVNKTVQKPLNGEIGTDFNFQICTPWGVLSFVLVTWLVKYGEEVSFLPIFYFSSWMFCTTKWFKCVSMCLFFCRFSCAGVVKLDKERKRFEFHGSPRVWKGKTIKSKIKGNSTLYILEEEVHV